MSEAPRLASPAAKSRAHRSIKRRAHRERAAGIQRMPKRSASPSARTGKAHGEQNQIGVERKLRAGFRTESAVDAFQLDRTDTPYAPILASKPV